MDLKRFHASDAVIRKEVTFGAIKDEVWVRRLPSVDIRRYHAELGSDNIDVRAKAGYAALAASIRNEDGGAAGTVKDFEQLPTIVYGELMRVFNEVNLTADDELGNA